MGRPLVLPPLRRTRTDARKFAEIVHFGQVDKAGAPYIEHVYWVARDASKEAGRLGLPDDLEDAIAQIGQLHDVLEPDDRPFGHVSTDDLRAEGFSEDVIASVTLLTRCDEPYADYIDAIAEADDVAAILVKIADLEDNLDPDRLGRLDPAKAASLRKRYEPALARLKAALADPSQPR